MRHKSEFSRLIQKARAISLRILNTTSVEWIRARVVVLAMMRLGELLARLQAPLTQPQSTVAEVRWKLSLGYVNVLPLDASCSCMGRCPSRVFVSP